MQLGRVREQWRQRPGRIGHALLGPTGGQIPQQPGRRLRQIPPSDRERAERIRQITRQLAPGAWPGRRDDRHGREPAAVAITGRLLAAGIAGFDDRDAMPVAEQLERGRSANGPGSDDGHMPAHDRSEAHAGRQKQAGMEPIATLFHPGQWRSTSFSHPLPRQLHEARDAGQQSERKHRHAQRAPVSRKRRRPFGRLDCQTRRRSVI